MRHLVEVSEGGEAAVFLPPNFTHDLPAHGPRTAAYNAWQVVRFFLFGI